MSEDPSDDGNWVMSPLLVSAIGFAVVLRITEVYFRVTSTMSGLAFMWRNETVGGFGLIELFCLCAIAFAFVAILEVLRTPKKASAWIAVAFCLLLTLHALGIFFFTEASIDRGHPIESLPPF